MVPPNIRQIMALNITLLCHTFNGLYRPILLITSNRPLKEAFNLDPLPTPTLRRLSENFSKLSFFSKRLSILLIVYKYYLIR